MKYLLIAILLSANVSADDRGVLVATGICAVMVTQMKAETVTSNIVKYWELTAKDANVTFSQYYAACEELLTVYNESKAKAKKGAGKL